MTDASKAPQTAGRGGTAGGTPDDHGPRRSVLNLTHPPVGWPAEAAYDPAENIVRLTVYVEDVEDVSADESEAIRRTAEEAVADQGVKVDVILSDETPPGPE